jgi:pimeloyl-ACP methyl ester carboxylesterase
MCRRVRRIGRFALVGWEMCAAMGNEHVFVRKIGEGFPIVMLHGFPLDHRSLLPLEQCFSQHDHWQRYYIDLPGLGQSCDGFDIRSASDVLKALGDYLTEEFAEIDFAIVGYSFGGLLASALAAQYGDHIRSIFLLAPEVVPDDKARTLPKKTVYHVSDLPRDAAEQEITAYKATAVVESAENFELFKRYILPGLMGNSENEAVRYLADNPALATTPAEYMSQYRHPVTIVVGKNDTMVGYEDAFALPDAAGGHIRMPAEGRAHASPRSGGISAMHLPALVVGSQLAAI